MTLSRPVYLSEPVIVFRAGRCRHGIDIGPNTVLPAKWRHHGSTQRFGVGDGLFIASNPVKIEWLEMDGPP
jgi:hypothetical protein